MELVLEISKNKKILLKKKRIEVFMRSSKILGIKNILNLDFPDNKLDSVPILDIIQPIEKKILNLNQVKLLLILIMI